MAIVIENILAEAIKESKENYYRLVLLIGESESGKTKALNRLSDKIGVPVLNLNLWLSELLLELTPTQRSLQLPKILQNLIHETGTTIILDNTEILFDASLKQDPLKLLQGISRNKTIIASWNGKEENKNLHYAEVNHPEYRVYELMDFLTVNMNGEYNFNT